MCLVFVCDKDEKVVRRHQASGSCPYCGGMVQAIDVNSKWRFCFVPLSSKTKSRFICSSCGHRLNAHMK